MLAKIWEEDRTEAGGLIESGHSEHMWHAQIAGGDSVPTHSQIVDGSGSICLNRNSWALNSAVECHPHTVEVVGSNPTAPTTRSNRSSFLTLPAA
jgi:hypothetical protein